MCTLPGSGEVATDVHGLKPGELGLVAHKMRNHELNAWVRRAGSPPSSRYFPSDLVFHGNLYVLDLHIPHSTMVLVLSENQLRNVSFSTFQLFYQVIWNEMVCFVKRDLVINPHANDQKP